MAARMKVVTVGPRSMQIGEPCAKCGKPIVEGEKVIHGVDRGLSFGSQDWLCHELCMIRLLFGNKARLVYEGSTTKKRRIFEDLKDKILSSGRLFDD